MSGAKASVLAQKIGRVKRAAPAPSGLAEFAAALGKAAEEAVGELLSASLEASVESGDARLPEALASAPNPGVYYWLLGDQGSLCALAVIAPEFAAVASERLLGGELGPPAENVSSSLLDHEMAGLLADVLSRAVNHVLTKRSHQGVRRDSLVGRRGARSPQGALAGLDPTQAFSVSIRLAYAGGEAPAAIRLHFPAAFLDRAGLHGGAHSPKCPDPEDVSWASRLRKNLLHTEIPLSAVLGRIRTNVGDLSRLKAGQVFDLEPDAINSLEISAATRLGPAVIVRARLGSYHSNKAIKLTSPIDPDFIRDF